MKKEVKPEVKPELAFEALIEQSVEKVLQKRALEAPDRLLSVTEVCESLSVSKPTVYKLLADKKLSGLFIGKRVLVKQKSLAEFIGAKEHALGKV